MRRGQVCIPGKRDAAGGHRNGTVGVLEGPFWRRTPSEVQGSTQNEDSVQRARDDYYEVAGPRSPLWQAENGHLSADGENQPESGFCTDKGGSQAPEREAISAGIGRLTAPTAGR